MKDSLIINADDFGLSATINKAIIYSFENGIINSTSLMTNTPAFGEAVEMAKAKGYSDNIGVHVNLTEGKPLTNFNHLKYLNKDGSWNKDTITSTGFFINKKIRDDFSKEILAQIRSIEKIGIIPSHINSHHHIHTLPIFFPLFLRISRSYGYKLRIAQTHFSGSYLKSAYRKYINGLVKKSGNNFSDYFETVESYYQRKQILKNGKIEIMVHPSFDENGMLIDVLDKDKSGTGLKKIQTY